VFDAQGSYAAVILGCAVLSMCATYASWRSVQGGPGQGAASR
jgi:hypothetical protein